MRYVFIAAEKAAYPVSLMCSMLEVSCSGYYAWCGRSPSARAQRDHELTTKIRCIHERSERRYGSPRIHEELAASDTHVGRKRVARLKHEDGISARAKRRFVKTTDSNHDLTIAPNQLKRNFFSSAPNKVWVGDITYLDTHQGWLYLAIIVDLFSRRVVGWAMSQNIDTALVMSALNMAVVQRSPARDLIVHSDRGSQYATNSLSTKPRRFQSGLRAIAARAREVMSASSVASLPLRE